VEEVEIVKLDECSREVPGSERRLSVEGIALAVGLLPQTELAQQAGCELEYNADLGGHIPKRSEDMETSVPGIYVAGDLGGIEEATVAIEEGRLAGLSAAQSLGYGRKDKEHQKAEIRSRLAQLRYEGKKKPCSVAAPSKDEGPEILIECPEEIPCNPCEEVCPQQAIKVGSPITNLPRFKEERCTGCGLCIAVCPAQAIFLIDRFFSEDCARLDLPYEELPRPRKHQIVGLLDREGKEIAKGQVIRTRLTKAFNKTTVVSVAVPQKIADNIRYIDCKD